ncbi:MAG: enoyl-CoA hydratase/isomerase family protein [Acidimicrobiia bacterium]
MQTGTYCGFEVTAHDPGIACITFNRPERLNGTSSAMKRDLIEVLTQMQMDDTVRVVLFTGTGAGFCAGDTIGPEYRDDQPVATSRLNPGHEHTLGTYDGLRVVSQGLNKAIRELNKMTIAAINGFAIQTGLSLALCCDFRIAAKGAKLGSATLRFGLLPDEGGHYLLVQHLGLGRAMDFLFRKRIVTAEQAAELGLVHEVVEPEALLDEAMALAVELANGPQIAMRLLKRATYNAAELSWAQALDDIAVRTPMADHHPDAREGGAAFLERRQPTFNAWLSGGGAAEHHS